MQLFKTPWLCEGHLSLRPVTMATSPAQCSGEGGEQGADTMATQAVGNRTDGEERALFF